jgi:hypothetical protein
MRLRAVWIAAALGGSCTHAGPRGTLSLRSACEPDRYWNGTACTARGDGAAKIAEGKAALAKLDVDQAKTALAAADRGGPLDHDTHITLWEQRGIAAAYVDDEATATSAFDMLLALDPGHFLSYTLSPKATFVFEKVRSEMKARGAPGLDVNWERGGRVGDPVPLDVEVIADPKQFLRRATLFVRTRGESSWRAADLTLGHERAQRIALPPIAATKPVSLEHYLRAYDDLGNEVLAWADPVRPREIPLRYDPPTPLYRKWWPWAIAGFVGVVGTGAIVYFTTLAPPDTVMGDVDVK